MAGSKKIFSMATVLSVLATANLCVASDVPDGISDAEGELPATKIYTPARAAVSVDQHLISPFYVYYGQRLPAALSTHGKIASSTYGTGCAWRYVAKDKTRISLTNLDYRRTDFRFSGGADKLFEHTDSLRAMTYQEFINPESGRAFVGILSGSVSAEDGTDLASSGGGLVGIAGKQYFSETTSAMLGISVFYRSERQRWYCLPIFSFDYSISPTLNLRLLNGLTLTWDVFEDDSLLLDFFTSYETSAFAIGGESIRAAGKSGKDGAYYEESVPVGVSGTWNFSKNLYLRAGVAVNTWTKYRLIVDGHKTDEKFTTDPTLDFSLQIGWQF